MIEFSSIQKNTFLNIFSVVPLVGLTNAATEGLSLNNNNVFNRFCVIDVTGDNIEIPVFSRPIVEDVIKTNIIMGAGYTKVVLPMYVNTHPQYKRTAHSIIRNFFVDTNLSQRLRKVTTGKGNVYYGGRGVIFDENFNLLLMCTISCEKATHEGRNMMKYTKITVYVHPNVFLEPEGLIHKEIIKKIIPFYISNSINIIGLESFFLATSDITADVVIADAAKKFIKVPEKPTPQRCSNDILNQVLIDNIDDVLNQIV